MEARRKLTVTNHDRDVAGTGYVYPVLSRRAGGVSVGINLNTNHACNWHCAYCQVTTLGRGRGPAIQLERLRAELDQLLRAIVHGDFLKRALATPSQLSDVAFSGDGEPTTSPSFPAAVETVRDVLSSLGLVGRLPVVLITNGSMLHSSTVQQAVARLGQIGGAIWFKLDGATQQQIARINGVRLPSSERLRKLRHAVRLAPTWIQTCLFEWDGQAPAERDQEDYLDWLAQLAPQQISIAGVLLYTMARPSAQPAKARIGPLSRDWLEVFADRVRALGLLVRVSG